MSYNIRTELPEARAAELHALYQGAWWTRGRTLEDVRAMLRGASLIYAVCEDDTHRLAGFARVLTDGVFKALIFDLIVEPAHRDRGLGQELMATILSDTRLARVRHFELYCLPDLVPFYERFGFSSDVDGVGLMRYER